MDEEHRIPGSLAGVAGEYFVAAELTRRGYIAAITLRNTPGVDIIATNAKRTRSVNIQVKTIQGRRTWVLNKKHEQHRAKNSFYVFVSLGKRDERPRFYIVPSNDVARWISDNHKRFLGSRGKHGQKHKDTSMRTFTVGHDEHRENWNILGL